MFFMPLTIFVEEVGRRRSGFKNIQRAGGLVQAGRDDRSIRRCSGLDRPAVKGMIHEADVAATLQSDSGP